MSKLTLKEKAQKGIKFEDTLIIDAHAHLVNLAYQPNKVGVKDERALIIGKFMLHRMDIIGVDKVCVSSILALHGDLKRGNMDTEKVLNAYPERFFGYYVVNPNDLPSRNEMEKWLDKPGVIGFKIHPNISSYPVDGDGYIPVWETALKKKAVVLSHTWGGNIYCDPLMFSEIARSYPSVPIILGHMGGSTEGIVKSVKVAKEHENIFLETDNYNHPFGVIEYLVNEIGASRVLCGTDTATEPISVHLGVILYARISEENKKKILGLNMEKLIK